ncbi:MAG: bifunctional 5,10-methylenetetrahydrofolate dehydrogenase/5,10-methenyltetrahydrofolate cyclohydrolase [Bacteroidales bacterium]|jgi:methylenetetrahydrofolate dehydrogenase (NADP+)/methenyltetrahydrofolate cyclohydrolase|nr:bifunctional 5,10-methylenetetrahydrofolate dehydrogenase/5,10-methenyltetrahydrofolate cyclohydrolase [Bacteroidales bacterium]MBR4638563.1 bifunctional 5,10-methylenetetrahydrofolate dehydrogenase/5,10-methenyltetrahydrofolate cyclohydrolase [Bacteroidales bacterium]MBR5921243.1 bifunctional 5,10-methylenetetrahydrofolate dehydrogenase/5,10-methenyltetrahydrofolate cyclohydrolase [Bacteroidales bacterium]MCR4873714.1 bifunctional 5,10-methylenetetrahydrofolate dehydrogenase/5,10-methenyltet
MARIIDGKQISEDIKTEIAIKVKELLDKGLRAPHLAVVIAGDDGAALSYVSSIEKQCKGVGFISSVYHLSANTTEEEFLATIDFINQDDEIDGYIIQMPLPKQVSIDKVTAHVSPAKDMDCFHPENMGNLLLGKECYLPATPHGVIELLKRSDIETSGKNCVIVGRSNIVGKPLAMLMLQKSVNATVTVCHSRTENLPQVCRRADILIVAIGQPEMITAEYVKEGATVFDVGVHRIEDATQPKGYRLCGDVKFDEVSKICDAITPVPGGTGAMTTACLLQNTLTARMKKL